MQLLSKERLVSVIIILAVVAYGLFVTFKLFESQTLMLIDNDAKDVVEFCEKNVKICEVGQNTYSEVE